MERTLLDLSAVLSPRKLQRAFEEADRLRFVDRGRLDEVLALTRGRHGAGSLVSLARSQLAPVPRTRSNQEMRVYRVCEKAGLPLPEMNEKAADHEVDCLWRDLRLVIELDSSFHDSPLARERDRRRDRDLEGEDHRVHRIRPDLVYDDAALAQYTWEMLRIRAAELGVCMPEPALQPGATARR